MSSRGGCARWRAGVGVGALVCALGVGAAAGAPLSVAAPVPIADGYQYLNRLEGPDRVATAVVASQANFSAAGSAPGAVITTSATYADALAGAALAAKVGGPLLLTSPTTLEPTVATEMRRAVKAGGTIYVLGDAGAVSADVEAKLRPGFTVTRLAGVDRYATAVAIANQMRALGAKGPAYLATGTNYPDGLTVSTLAAHTDGVVVLAGVNQEAVPTLDRATQAWIEKDDPAGARTVPVGGPAAAASANGDPSKDIGPLPSSIRARAIIGVDRYDTSRRVAEAYGALPGDPGKRKVGLATGENWPDALVGAAVMGYWGGPLLITDGNAAQLNAFTEKAVDDLSQDRTPTSGLVFGGSDVISDAVATRFGGLLPGETI